MITDKKIFADSTIFKFFSFLWKITGDEKDSTNDNTKNFLKTDSTFFHFIIFLWKITGEINSTYNNTNFF